MPQHILLRPETDADLPFLEALYAGARWEEVEALPWPGSQKTSFLRDQFHAQRRAFQSGYPGASFEVIEIDGIPAGRLYVERRVNEIRIVDILLAPSHRGKGIGGRLLRQILAEADRSGSQVTLHVEAHNPADRLYRRLGFEEVGSSGVHILMVRHPIPDAQRSTP